LILSAGLLLSSCGKKDWTCSCSYTVDAFFFTYDETVNEQILDAKEDDAEADCDAFEADIQADFPSATCLLSEND